MYIFSGKISDNYLLGSIETVIDDILFLLSQLSWNFNQLCSSKYFISDFVLLLWIFEIHDNWWIFNKEKVDF